MALPVTVTTPATTPSNSKLENRGKLRFRRLPLAALAAYPLDVGEPGFATDFPALMVGSAGGNVLFSPMDAAATAALISGLADISSVLAERISTLEEKFMSFIPVPVAPVAVPVAATGTLVRPLVPTTYEVDESAGAVTLTLYPSIGSNLPIKIDNVKGTANVAVQAGAGDVFDTPPFILIPGASMSIRDYAAGKWVID